MLTLLGCAFVILRKKEITPGVLAYIFIPNFGSFKGNLFLITLVKSCPHWQLGFFRSEIHPPTFLSVLGHLSGILLVYSSYRRGQWAGHQAHPNFGFLSSLPPPLFWVCLYIVCLGQRRDPPPPCMQEEPSGNGIKDPGASWHGCQR